ncbi:MAG: metallophosphoesterase, partial [Clostridia bacterium]|nr:metallophosphoesterase [Clostridia bacterium]
MTYVFGDLFGEYEKYRDMLAKINLKSTDVVYILGNVIDYGEEGIEILTDMSYRANVIPVIGEHEYYALKVLRELLDT